MSTAELTGVAETDPATGPDQGTDDQSGNRTSGPTAPASRFRSRLAVGLLVVLLAALGSLVWLATQRSGDQADLAAEREQAMSVSEQFVLRMGTYGPDLLDDQGAMPDYRERMTALMTTRFGAEFEDRIGADEKRVAQTGVSLSADVFGTGVAQIDSDSATVLVAGALTESYEKTGKGEPLAVRLEVSLVQVDGEWLVDGIGPIGGGQQ